MICSSLQSEDGSGLFKVDILVYLSRFCLACVAKKRDIGAAFPVTAATATAASTSKT